MKDEHALECFNPITESPVFNALIKYFLPLFLGSLVQQSYNFVDALIIGRYAGASSLAAIDATYSYTKLLIHVFIALALGGTVIISQYYGARKVKEVSKVVHTLIAFSLIGGVIITVFGVYLAGSFTSIMNVPSDIFELSVRYLSIYFLGTTFSFLYNIGAGILRAVGDSKRPFYYLIVSSILNIILDIVFIIGFDMGITGAALGTVLSQFVSSILIIITLIKNNSCYALCIKKIKLDISVLRDICRIGVPMGAQSALYAISNMFMQGAVNTFGTVSIAAWAICGKMDFFIWIVVDTLGIAITTFVAQNYGAKKHDRMRSSVKYGIAFALFIVSLFSLALYFFVQDIASWFTGNIDVIADSVKMIHLLAPFYILYIGSEILSGAVKGIGKTFKPMIITLIGTCGLKILWVSFILPQRPSIAMALIGYPVCWFVTSLMFSIYYLSVRKWFQPQVG